MHPEGLISRRPLAMFLAYCLVAEHAVLSIVRSKVLHSGMLTSVCVCFPDVEVDVDELSPEQVLELNKMATPYGMAEGDFVWSVCC